jgi:hypothetical protein
MTKQYLFVKLRHSFEFKASWDMFEYRHGRGKTLI